MKSRYVIKSFVEEQDEYGQVKFLDGDDIVYGRIELTEAATDTRHTEWHIRLPRSFVSHPTVVEMLQEDIAELLADMHRYVVEEMESE